ncbi:MAG: D-glycero-beta-D-manno-heptose 1,7-bisphosphate 7-phosphatase [Pontibacterium sp.]
MKLVILDRDGVINYDSDDYVKSVDEWLPIEGSAEAIAQLNAAGYTVAVATNQSGIGRGYFSKTDLEAMHTKMNRLIVAAGGKIAHLAYCPHVPDDSCDCRKPLPGMLVEIKHALNVQPNDECWMIGDSLRDLQAGEAAGCKNILVRTGKGERTLARSTPSLPANTVIKNNLAHAVRFIVGAK